MSHTPRPWVAVFDQDERGADVNSESGYGVCNCGPEDAELIAAAPDLLAALKRMVAIEQSESVGAEYKREMYAAIEQAQAAIARAES